jgi:hypothetical protein
LIASCGARRAAVAIDAEEFMRFWPGVDARGERPSSRIGRDRRSVGPGVPVIADVILSRRPMIVVFN